MNNKLISNEKKIILLSSDHIFDEYNQTKKVGF